MFVREMEGISAKEYHSKKFEEGFRRAAAIQKHKQSGLSLCTTIFNEYKSAIWMAPFSNRASLQEHARRSGLLAAEDVGDRKHLHRGRMASKKLQTPHKVSGSKRPAVALSNKKRHEILRKQKSKLALEERNRRRWDDWVKEAEADLYETYVSINKTLTQWLKIWENQKANGEKGMPGSPNTKGAINGIAIIYSIIYNEANTEILKKLGFDRPWVDDAGCGVGCFLKIIRILLNCGCAGFEYKKMLGMFLKEFRFEDATIYVPMVMQVLRAIREIDEKVSLYHGGRVAKEPFVLKFDQGWHPEKAKNGKLKKTNYKKFLKTECGFKHEVSNRKGRIIVMFCEGWEKEDLESLTRSFSDFNTSGAGIAFIANNPNKINWFTDNDGKETKIKFDQAFFLKNLNHYVNDDTMKFVQVREKFPISAGKTHLTGYILARNCLVPDCKTEIKFREGKVSTIHPNAQMRLGFPNVVLKENNKYFVYFDSERPLPKLAFQAVQWKIENEFNFRGRPGKAFCSQYLGNLGNQGINFVEDAIEEYSKSWNLNYFQDEFGDSVVTDRRLSDGDQPYTLAMIKDDFIHGISDAERQGFKVKFERNYFCEECGLTGLKDTVFNHLLCKDYNCQGRHVKPLPAVTDDENEEENDEEDELEQKLSLTLSELEDIKSTERRKIYRMVRKALAANGITETSDEDLEKEYLTRLSVNISRNQAFVMARGKKVLRNVRYVHDRFVCTFDDGYKIDLPLVEITPATDSATLKRLLEKANLPIMFQRTDLKTDNTFVEWNSNVRSRIYMAINHKDRKKFFRLLNGTLVFSGTVDGAPKGKNGQMLSITFILLNEGIKFTSNDVMPLVLTAGAESDKDSYTVCSEVGAVIKAFKDSVSHENPYVVVDNEGKRYEFHTVIMINSSDLAAQCKVDGWGGTGSQYPHSSVIGLNHRSCGPYGSDFGRSKGVDEKDTDFDINDTFLRNWSPSTDKDAKWEKPGDRPVAILSCEHRQKLFDAVEQEVGKLWKHCTTEEEKEEWLKQAREIARKYGHSQYKPPLFGVYIFDLPSFCALHFKTIEVKDILVHGASLMRLWDAANGNQIVSMRTQEAKLGKALQYYFDEIENAPEYRNQLVSWCSDHAAKCLGNAAKSASKDINVEFKRLSRLLESLAEDASKSTRLIGVMANVVLAKPWVIVGILIKALETYKARSYQKKKKKKQFAFGISVLAAKLYCLKDVVLNLSLASYDIKEISEMSIRYKHRAKQMEYIHSYFLPNMARMYDVVATCIAPLVFTLCIDIGISPGGAGLLESREQFHQCVVQCPTFPLSLEAAIRLNRKSWTYQVIRNMLLVKVYKETRDDTRTPYPSKEIRQVKREGNQNNKGRGEGNQKGKVRQQRSYIYDPFETPYLQNERFSEELLKEPWVLIEERCGCGRFNSFDKCEICSFGYIKELWKKTNQCAKLLIKRESSQTVRGDDTNQVKALLRWLSKMDDINILRHFHAELEKKSY